MQQTCFTAKSCCLTPHSTTLSYQNDPVINKFYKSMLPLSTSTKKKLFYLGYEML